MRPAALLALALAACSSVPKAAPATLLAEGKRLREAGEGKRAAKYFKAVEGQHPEADEVEEAIFLRAETQREMRNPQRAFEAYQKFVEKYPHSRFSIGVATGEYDLGTSLLEGKFPGFFIFRTSPSYGVQVLEHLHMHFRNHSLADDALMRIADFHVEEKEYEEAVEALRTLLQQYPRSTFVLRARFQLARAFWLQSDGPDYDERTLEHARRTFEDFIGTVRRQKKEEELAEKVEAAQQMIRTIHERLAEKHYRIGRFYERTEHPRSAQYHYEFCVRSFPGAAFAERSSRRLAAMREGLPAPDDEDEEAGKAPEPKAG
jgi:outer membrane protein assembly factor BamD (BamD/ComL family)